MKTIKKLSLLIICILFGIQGMAQQNFKDAVHPLENRKTTLDYNIKNYRPDSLYQGYDYEYYHKKYKSAKTLRNAGLSVTVIGLTIITGGLIAAVDQGVVSGASDNVERAMFAGLMIANIGAPLWISGGIMTNNNHMAMKRSQNVANLSFGITNNGVGLVLKF